MAGSFWTDRVVLVTGAGGYLAGRLAGHLTEHGARVIGVDVRPVDSPALAAVEQGDLTDLAFVSGLLARYQVATCFHLAGHAGVAFCDAHPLEAFDANCRATWTVLEAARRLGTLGEIIITSSNHVYGEQAQMPTTEEAPLNGRGVYAVSKGCADLVARCYAHQYGLPVGVARITNTFGGRDPHADHLVTGTILAVLAGQPPMIRGNGSAVKGFLYIEDTIDALILFAERLRERGLVGEAINVVPAAPASVLEIVQAILTLAGADHLTPVILGDPARPEEHQHLSGELACTALGWQPRYSLTEGLRLAIEDLRQVPAEARRGRS